MDRKIIKKLREVPPCSVFITQGRSFVSKLIGLWWLITHLKKFPESFSHVGIYWGSIGGRKFESIETNLRKIKIFNFKVSMGLVSRCNFLDHFEHDKVILIYHNKYLKKQNLNLAYAYARGTVGRPYDIPAFVRFVFPKFKEIKGFDICTENTAETIRNWAKLPFVPKKKAYEIHPSEVYEYFESKQGKKDGWYRVFEWAADSEMLKDIRF